MTTILKDVERTFTDSRQFVKGTTSYFDLVNVLHAISVYKPEIRYVQGMNFIIGSLIPLFSAEECFWLFQSLTTEYKLSKMYTENMPLLRLFSFQLRTL